MTSLLASTKTSIQQLLLQAMDSDLPSLEELVQYHITQVACVALHHQWTKDCEQVRLSVCQNLSVHAQSSLKIFSALLEIFQQL